MIALPAFLAVLAVLLAFGDRLCRLLGLGSERPAERFGLALATSFGVLTLAVFLLALPRWVNFWSMLALLAAMALVAGRSFLELPSWLRAGVSEFRRGALGWLSGTFLGLGFIAAMAPPTGIDTLAFHFVAPKLWLHAGGLLPDPHPYYHRTGGFYFVYLFGMALQNDLLAKLLHFGASTASIVLCGATADRLRAGSGGWAVAAALTSPVVASYLGYEFLELPAQMYVTAGLFAAVRAGEGGGRWTSAALGYFGFALGVKPSGFPVLLLAGTAVVAAWRREGRRALPSIGAGAGLALLAGGFWQAWNLWTLRGVLAGYHASALPGMSTSLWRTQGQVLLWLLGSPPYWSDALGPLLVLGVAGGLCFRSLGSRGLALQALGCLAFYLGFLGLAAPYYLVWHTQIRYLSPVLLALAAPAAGLFLSRIPRGWALAALLVPALPLLALKAGRTAVAAPAALGLQGVDVYLSRKVETYEACRAVNAMPGRLRVLAWIFRPYHLGAERLAAWEATAEGKRGVDVLAEAARSEGITHVLVEQGYLDRRHLGSMESYFEGSAFRPVGEGWPQPDGRRIRLYELLPP